VAFLWKCFIDLDDEGKEVVDDYEHVDPGLPTASYDTEMLSRQVPPRLNTFPPEDIDLGFQVALMATPGDSRV
jgi:hypothetical protein